MTDPQIAIMMLGIFVLTILLGFPICFTLIAMGVAFGYYVTQERRRTSFSVEDLEFHFAHAGVRAPRNLANALGTLKRKRKLIERGELRGTYVLTSAGLAYARHLLRS